MRDKPIESNWIITDYKVACRAFKTEEDSFKIPAKKDELVELWKKLKVRAADVQPLPQEENTQVLVQAAPTAPPTTYENEAEVLFDPLAVPTMDSDDAEDLTADDVHVDCTNLIGLASICSDLMTGEVV